MNSTSISITDQLLTASRAGELENLRAVLAQQQQHDQGGRRCAVTNDDIRKALFAAAEVGCVESCLILWERIIDRGGKRKNFYNRLHDAVIHGHLGIVRLFIEEFEFNVNQKNSDNRTPLFYAINSEEMASYLLEHGADVNLDSSLLRAAVEKGNTEVVRLLFQYGADPNLRHLHHITKLAISRGYASEILSILLEHGPFMGDYGDRYGVTSLNKLLHRSNVTREAKLSICRILVEHAKEDSNTATLIQDSFKIAIMWTRNDSCEILLQAGMNPSSHWAWYCAIQMGDEPVCHLLVQYGADPFENEEEDEEPHAFSPFLAAARQSDTSIFEYLLGVWDSQFSSTGGKNSDGDYPLHVVCCDPCVSLQAIQVLVNRQSDSLAVVDGEQGLLPFHFAANWGASLDVIFYLLQHCPSALHHVGNTRVPDSSSTRTMETSNHNNDDSSNSSHATGQDHEACEPVKKKAKTSSM